MIDLEIIFLNVQYFVMNSRTGKCERRKKSSRSSGLVLISISTLPLSSYASNFITDSVIFVEKSTMRSMFIVIAFIRPYGDSARAEVINF